MFIVRSLPRDLIIGFVRSAIGIIYKLFVQLKLPAINEVGCSGAPFQGTILIIGVFNIFEILGNIKLGDLFLEELLLY